MRPLGQLQNVLNHLDKYELDEICIVRPIRNKDESFHSDIERIKKAKSSTPLAFGGGIRSMDDINFLEGLPIERFVVSSALFFDDIKLIERLHGKYGKQSILGFIPFFLNPTMSVFNSSKNCFQSPQSLNVSALTLCDELVLHDCAAEGEDRGFNEEVLVNLDTYRNKLILSGGVSEIARIGLSFGLEPKSILIENKILHRENSLKSYYGAM